MYAVGRGVGDKSCRESRRGSVYRVIRNRAAHTHGGGRAYALFTAVCPRSAARSTVWGSTVRSNCLVVFPLLFFPLFTTVFPHTHTRSHSPSSFTGFTCHLSRSLLSQAKAPTSSM
uniref:(northern house mosquito) hypothetical protein n=1 Tax=Culex pipiens TaxID=7175 RepID=A0A8D8CP11_CULPI